LKIWEYSKIKDPKEKAGADGFIFMIPFGPVVDFSY